MYFLLVFDSQKIVEHRSLHKRDVFKLSFSQKLSNLVLSVLLIAKCFQPKLEKNKDLEKIIFTRAFNPNHVNRSLENIRSNEQCFRNKTVQLATTQPKNFNSNKSKI